MLKINVFNTTNDFLIVDTFKNVFQRRSNEVYASLSIQCHTLYMLVGPLKKVDKSVSSESGQFSTSL